MLGEQVGEGVLVISPVAHVVINKNIRFNQVVNPRETGRISGVCLDKIPVEVVISGISPKTVFHRAILVCPAAAVAVKGPSYIVHRYGYNNRFFRRFQLPYRQIPKEHQSGIDTVAFSRMYSIIDEDDRLFLPDLLKIEVAIRIEGHHMQGVAGIGIAYGLYVDFREFFGQANIKIDYLFIGGRFISIAQFKRGFVFGNLVFCFGFTGKKHAEHQ